MLLIVWVFDKISSLSRMIPGIWLLLFWILPTPCLHAAEPYSIAPAMKGAPLGRHFEILADPTGQLGLQDILEKDAAQAFRPSQETVPNFGLRRGPQWVKFTIHNPLQQELTILLENKFTLADSLELYYQNPAGDWLKKAAGDQRPFIERDIHTRQAVFRLTLAPGSHRFYARTFADGAHQLPLHIWTQDEFFAHNAREYGWIGILVGFHLVICLYNLFLYFSLRDRTYLYYVLYVTCNLFYQSASLGLFQQSLSMLGWAESFSNRFTSMNVDMVSITALLFSYHFLNIKEKLPIFRRIYLAIGALDATNLVVTGFISVYFGTAICLVTASMTTSTLLASGFLISRQRYIPAMFYITGWGCYLLGVTGTILNLIGLLPTSNFSRWGQFTGGAIEIAILSLALGARINAKRREHVQMITRLNQDLEGKVEERTAEIQSLLLHIPQGILSIGRDGLITPNYSAQLPSILNHDAIAGQSFRSIILDRSTLSADEKDQAWQSIQAAVGEHSLSFDLNIDKLPAQLDYIMNDQMKVLRLTWNRELNAQDEVKHILVTLLDVSSEVAAQQEIERQNREFEIIKQLVDLGSRKSVQFFSAGDQLINENERLLRATNLDTDTIKILFVNTHTLKGAARSLQLKELANKLHVVESYYAQVLKFHQPLDRARLQQDFTEAKAIYQRYHRANRETLGRLDDLKKVTVDRDFMQDNVKLLNQLLDMDALPRNMKAVIQAHRDEITGMIYTKLPSFIEELRHHADKIAKDLGLEPPLFQIEVANILINTSQELSLKNAFIHLLRNALDHGIEPGGMRKQKGKPTRGTLLIRAEERNGQIQIEFQDDGQGLDIGRIREICRKNGKTEAGLSAAGVASMILENGFSTNESVSMTSGRGVGLAAVRQFMEAEGGRVEIVLGPRIPGTGEFHEFSIRLHLPATVAASWQRMVVQAS
ncbi:MAG TPA: 7TM diverse intracellular signaling domain-containing protein [Oligoflexus sp.]|uniref:7TM diverse intracellular signaling domain-containing protein n=1 Tax=Oligoflexus sp. TaxID=1971216 RepID=UPI002D7F27A4|nr:7TM diverse intracellular signaling domain-containing protein [Oligoflexus sp.]HET9241251.1 7TM diverse intracellular signaling domain-containing protein [Oligoflexus sp.]